MMPNIENNESLQDYIRVVKEAQSLCFQKDYSAAVKKVKELGNKYNDDLMLSAIVMISIAVDNDDAISLSYAFHSESVTKNVSKLSLVK